MEEAGIDVCVTITVNPIFMEKASGGLEEEIQRLETGRALKHIGATHEADMAREIVREFRQIEDGGT